MSTVAHHGRLGRGTILLRLSIAMALFVVIVIGVLVCRPAGYHADPGTEFIALAAPSTPENRSFEFATDLLPGGSATAVHGSGETAMESAVVDRNALAASGCLDVSLVEGSEGVSLFVAAVEGQSLLWFSAESGCPLRVASPAGGFVTIGLAAAPGGTGASFTVTIDSHTVTKPVASYPDLPSLYAAIAADLQAVGVSATAVPAGVRVTSPESFFGGGDQDGTAGRVRVRTQW